jgi:hypothetical protein
MRATELHTRRYTSGFNITRGEFSIAVGAFPVCTGLDTEIVSEIGGRPRRRPRL